MIGSDIVEKQLNGNFYGKFVDETIISSIENFKYRRSYWVAYFSFLLFCLIVGSLPTFIGYDFNYPFPTIMFCWNIVFAFLGFCSMLKMFSLEKKFNVFRKKKYLILFSLPPIILSISMCILAIFTTKYIGYPNGAFKIEFNPFFYFFIFIPLYFGYVVFLYYAFLKCFGKYTRKNIKTI